jgi:hypothetical protein
VFVDALCGEPGARPEPRPSATSTELPVPADPARRRPVSYLFYFDMPHLTQPGRQDAIASAREMLPKLLAGGNRAMLVSNAKELRTLVPMTTDVAQLDAALAKMTNDIDDFDPYAAQEEERLSQVVLAIQNRLDTALHLAREYAREGAPPGRSATSPALRMVLGRLSELDARRRRCTSPTRCARIRDSTTCRSSRRRIARPEGQAPSETGADIALSASTPGPSRSTGS